jgi:hypothetical protein
MISIKLMVRLGNQIFQYCVCRIVAEKQCSCSKIMLSMNTMILVAIKLFMVN